MKKEIRQSGVKVNTVLDVLLIEQTRPNHKRGKKGKWKKEKYFIEK